MPLSPFLKGVYVPTSLTDWTLLMGLLAFFAKEAWAWLRKRYSKLEDKAESALEKRLASMERSISMSTENLQKVETLLVRHDLEEIKLNVKEISQDLHELAGALAVDRVRSEAGDRLRDQTLRDFRDELWRLKTGTRQ